MRQLQEELLPCVAAPEARASYWQKCKSKMLEYVPCVDSCCITRCTHVCLYSAEL